MAKKSKLKENPFQSFARHLRVGKASKTLARSLWIPDRDDGSYNSGVEVVAGTVLMCVSIEKDLTHYKVTLLSPAGKLLYGLFGETEICIYFRRLDC